MFLAALLLIVAVLVWSRSTGAALDHDEHQFVAGGALLARRGLLPYVDYPYFHTPYLVFADALLFRCAGPAGTLLLAARGLSAACGVATAGLIGAATLSAWRTAPTTTRRLAAAGAVLLLVANPIFAGTTGLAWNHDAAELLLVAAALLFGRAAERGIYGPLSMLAAGALLGTSIGVRLTIAPAVAAMAGMALADPRPPWPRRFRSIGLLLLGVALAMLPCAWLFLRAPEAFIFGNFEYPALNTAYHIAHPSMISSTTLAEKIGYVFTRILFSSGNGFLAALVALTLWLRRTGVDRAPAAGPTSFLGVLILFLLVGSFAPAPLFMVYFYAPVPFVILWLAYAWRPLISKAPLPRLSRCLAAGLLAACLACGVQTYRHVLVAFTPREWVPLRVHEAGVELRRRIASSGALAGPVLTLTPVIPLEGGLDVYEPYATGPFAMRVAPMVNEDRAKVLHLVDEEDLPALCRQRPPAAILVGLEGRSPEEAALLRGATRRHPETPVVRLGRRGPEFLFLP